MGASDVDGPSVGLRVRVVDALDVAQERLAKYMKSRALEITDDDLAVAEAAALIAIAQSLRALAAHQVAVAADPDPLDPHFR